MLPLKGASAETSTKPLARKGIEEGEIVSGGEILSGGQEIY